MLEKIKTKVKTVKFKTILSIVLYCTVLILAITLYQTYSAFRMSNSGNLFADTSGLICEISLDTNAEYVENDEAYFLINVQNYRGNLTNGVDIGYKITITNQNGSNGLFRYVDSDGKSNDEYVSTLYIPEHTFSTEKDTEIIKVYVKSSTNIEETVNYNVKLDAYQLVNGQVLLYEKLLSETYTLDTNVNFGSASSSTNGQGLMMVNDTQNDKYPVLYYRGDVNNNNIVYAGFCWLIVRTTETGGTKLIYNGAVNQDGSCNNYSGVTGKSVNTNYTNVFINGLYYAFNQRSDSPVYVGYMYNDTNKYYTHSANWQSGYDYYGTLDVRNYRRHLDDNSLDQTTGRHYQNLNNSVVKGVIDAWYSNHIDGTTNESLLEDTVWCNERTITSTENNLDNYASSGLLTYSAYTRIYEMDKVVPSLNCTREIDKFTVESKNGNGDLTHPVGMLTADELIMSGNNASGAKTYLSTPDERFWLLTPNNFGFGCSAVFDIANGGITGRDANFTDLGVRPSVSLGYRTTITSGNGSFQSPYRVG